MTGLENGKSQMRNGQATLPKPLEKTPIAELEFVGLPSRMINMVEKGMKTVWLEDLPSHPQELKKRLREIDQIGPYWVIRVVRAINRLGELT